MRVSRININLVWFSAILCLAGYPIGVITGVKVHYLLFSFFSFILFFVNFYKGGINKFKAYYFITLLIPTAHFLATRTIDLPFIYSALNYVIVPLVFFSINFSKFNLNVFVRIFQLFTFINLIGLILQTIGFESPILQQEFTYTNDVLHDRYGSFAGGSLVLGFIASISTIFSFYDLLCNKKRDALTYLNIVISLLTLVIAQSRRFYIFILIVLALMFLISSNKRINKKKLIKNLIIIAIAVAGFIFFLYQFKNDNYYASRFFSTFDFKYDASNALRILMWIKAFQTFINNFWFGIGMGGIGTIGKDVFDNLKDVEDLFVSESYFLKSFVEGGIFFGTCFFLISLHFFKKSFKELRNKNKSLAAYLFIFLFLDSFVSTTLETLLATLIFWIAVSILHYNDTDNLTDSKGVV